MSSLLTLAKDLEQQSKAQKQSTGEMLKAAFSEHEQSVRKGTERKREENQRRHPRTRAEYERGDGENRLSVLRTAGDMAHHPDGVSATDRHEREHSVVAGQQITDNYTHLRQQEDTAKMTARRGECAIRRAATAGGFLSCRWGCKPKPSLRRDDMDPPETGVAENDRAGKQLLSALGAAYSRTTAKAGRMGEMPSRNGGACVA